MRPSTPPAHTRLAAVLAVALLCPLLGVSNAAAAVSRHGAGIKVLQGSPYDFVSPGGIVGAEGYLWVANGNDDLVEVNAKTGAFVRHVADEQGVPIVSIAAAGGMVWTGQGGPDGPSKYQSIREWSASKGTLVRQLNSSADRLDDPLGIALSGLHLWVANASTSTSRWYVTELNVSNGSLVRTISSHLTAPDAVALGDGDVWVQNVPTDTLTVYSQATGAYLRTVSLPYSKDAARPAGGGMVVSGSALWVPMGQWLDVVSLKTDRVTTYKYSASEMAGGSCPQYPAIAGPELWVANCAHQSVTEVALSTGKVTNVLKGSAYAFDDPLDVVPLDQSMWVTNSGGSGGVPGGSVTRFPLP